MKIVQRERILSAVLLLVSSVALNAQIEQEVPTIDPTLTRIFGSDSIEIYGASLSPVETPRTFGLSGKENGEAGSS